MSRKVIEIVQVLVDRIEKNGYQQRAREENAFDLNKRLTEAEGWVAHWKQARQEAHEAGELMRAEIETLRQQLRTAAGRVDLTEENNRRLQAFVAKARQTIGRTMNYCDVEFLLAELAELDAGTEPTPVAERCPECDGSGMVDSGGFGPDGKAISVPCGGDCRGNPCPSQPAPVAEPLDAEGGA